MIALATLLPIGILLAGSLAADVHDALNPCFTWGAPDSASGVVSPGGACTSSGSTSETLPQMLARDALVSGGILLGGALGVAGVVRRRPILMEAGSALLFVESVPLVLGGAFVLTLLPAAFLTWRAWVEGRPAGAGRHSERSASTGDSLDARQAG